MTGEITLSGLVFPIGGVKERCLQHIGAGIRRILLPSRNEADIDDIPEDVRMDLQIIFVSRISEVVDAALEMLVANPPPPPIVTDASRSGHSEPLSVKGS
jgi:ATP-dependent Lon protease